MDEFHHDFSPWALLGRSWRIKSAPKHFWRPDFFTSHPGVPPSWCTALGVLLKGWTFDSHRKVKCRRPGLRAWHDFLVRRGNGWKGTSINGYTIDHSISFPQSLLWTRLLRFSAIYLVGGLVNINFIFPYVGNFIIPIDSYFSEGWPNHQPDIQMCVSHLFHVGIFWVSWCFTTLRILWGSQLQILSFCSTSAAGWYSERQKKSNKVAVSYGGGLVHH